MVKRSKIETTVNVGSDIRISPVPMDILDWCKKEFVLDNPEYFKKERMGLYLGGTSQNIILYQRDGDDVILPFGALQKVWKKLCNRSNFNLNIKKIVPVKYSSNIDLYEYQEKAVKAALHRKNGVLVMPCGSGKTQSGLEIIARVGGKALWLTHTQDLLNQSKKRAESVLDIDGRFGVITEGKVDIGTHITFATIQTMSKIDLSKYSDTWDIVIVDECQHCCGSPTRVTQFYKVITNLSARYKIGLTATPHRADGLEQSMFALLGDIFYTVTRSEVAHTTCPIKVKHIETGWMPQDSEYERIQKFDGTIDYNKVVEVLTDNVNRLHLVGDTIITYASNGPTIVLANRVQYLNDLMAYARPIKSVCLSNLGTSKSAKQERKEALAKLNDGEIQCVFATYQLAKEGLDVPNLRHVIFATPEKDETTVIQSAGRVGRKAEGKEYGLVIDFVDDFPMFKGWSSRRNSLYKKIGAEKYL